MNYTPKPGLNVPVITVLDDSGKVIADEQRRIVRHVVQNGYGADVIFGVGTTGEWNRIANTERQRIMEIEIDEVRSINAERGESRIEDRGSKIEDRRSRIEDRGSRIEDRGSMVDGRWSMVDGRWSMVEGMMRSSILDPQSSIRNQWRSGPA